MAGGPYPTKHGWQVKWREGGRGSAVQSETLAEKLDAEEFKVRVERAGNRWPVDEHGQKWIKGVGFPEWIEEDPGTPFLDYANKRIRSLVQAGRLSPGESRKYTTYARIIAGSMAVAPLLREQVEADPDLALQVAIDPMLARPLLHQLVGTISDEEIAEHASRVVVEDLTPDAIRAFILWQRVRPKAPSNPESPGLAWKTIKNYHGFLHGVLEQAYYEGRISKNWCKMTAKEIGKGVVVKKISLTPEEFWLIHSCMDPRFQDFVEAAVGTGCRFGEITASRVKDWHREERRLRVEEAWKRGLVGQGYYRGAPKTEAGERDVYVGHRTAEILDAAAEDKGPNDLLFPAVRGGRLWQNHFYEDHWQPAIRKAVARGLGRDGEPIYPRFHDLRHTHIFWLRRGGLRNELIRSMVGHADEEMTEKYGEVPVEVKRQATEAIDAGLRRRLRVVDGG